VVNQPDQHHRTGGGDDELTDQAVAVWAEQAEHQAADKPASCAPQV
jgi:hypothetical protein